MNKKRYFYIFFAVAVVVLAGCGRSEKQGEAARSSETGDAKTAEGRDSGVQEEVIGKNELSFSMKDSFYSGKIAVEILSSEPCSVYYTLDGTDPDETKTVYKEPVKLSAGKETKAVCIKAKGYFEDGTVSRTVVHTYFMGKKIEERFDTLVFSVTTDPYNLYDYEYGIFVEGKLRDEYMKEHPGAKIEPDDPANYNMRGRESEREVYLEIFEPDGQVIAEQAAGIRTYGGWSRSREQKSIKIYARKEYDEEKNKIRYEFFPWKTAANGDGSSLDSFKQLVLRNCGNDNGYAFIRDELFQTLAGRAGYKDYEAVRPAALFVNGDYRGLFWLHEVYCDEYFEDHYGDYSGSFEILEGGETFKEEDEDKENADYIADYDRMYVYSQMDLTEDANFEALCEMLDVENYLSYYALQIYIGNEDWPHNNYKTYRYYASEGEEYGGAPFDGKWRYLLHDLDFSFGIYGDGAYRDNIGSFVGENGEITSASPLFGQLMRRKDCREIFISKTLDLINGAFAPDHVNKVLEEMNTSRMNEQKNMYGKDILEKWVRPDQLEDNLETIRTYGKERAQHILKKYQDYFNLGEIFKLSVLPAEGCGLWINSFQTTSAFEGSYYADYPVTITADLPKGKKLAYWLVNQEKIYDEKLVLTSAAISDGRIEVSFILK